MRSHPVELYGLTYEAVDHHRDLHCAHYDDCLDVAVKRRWSSWSCSSCSVRGAARIAPPPVAIGGSGLSEAIEGGYSSSRWTVSRPMATQPAIREALQEAPQTAEQLAETWTPASIRRALEGLERRGEVEMDADGKWKVVGQVEAPKETKPPAPRPKPARKPLPKGRLLHPRTSVTQGELLKALAKSELHRVYIRRSPSTVDAVLRALEAKGMVERGGEGWRLTGRKRCRECWEERPVDEFATTDGVGDGLMPRCRYCTNGRTNGRPKPRQNK